MGALLVAALVGAATLLLAPRFGAALFDALVWVPLRLWTTRRIPEPPTGLGGCLLGHVPQLLATRNRSFSLFSTWAEQLGGVFRIRFLFGRNVLVVTDPELYQPLLRNGPAKLPKYTAPYAMFEVFTNPRRPNILSSPENEQWRAVRRAAVLALTMSNLRLSFPHIVAVTQRLLDALAAAGPGAQRDMDAVAAAITLDVIGAAGFGRDFNATAALGRGSGDDDSSDRARDSAAAVGIGGCVCWPRGSEVLRVIEALTVEMQARNNPLNRWLPWRQRGLLDWGGRMTTLVLDLAEHLAATPPPAHTLGAQLLALGRSRDEGGADLPREQICAEIGLFLGAGFETTAHSIAWALGLIATHPEVERRLCEELRRLGLLATPDAPRPAPLQWDHLAQLKYLSAVITESMRLLPVVASGTIRITDRPTKLGGHQLLPGQPVLIPAWAIHHSPALWQQPEQFRPERFLAKPEGGGSAPRPDVAAARDQAGACDGKPAGPRNAGQAPVHASASSAASSGLDLQDTGPSRCGWLGFSEGSRNCVGQALALLEMKAVLAMLVGNFSFELVGLDGLASIVASAKQAVTLKPERGMPMVLRHRSLLPVAAA